MMKTAKREDLLEHYNSLQLTAKQVETDILFSESASVEYAMDYSAFYDGITRRSRPRNAMDAVSGQLYSELIDAVDLPFSAFITGPTFLEVADGFLRSIEKNKRFSTPEITTRIKAGYLTIENIKAQPNPGNLHNFDLRQEYIEKELLDIDALVGKNVNSEIRRARKLVGDGGPVKGFGDSYRSLANAMQLSAREIEKKFEQLKASRWHLDRRSSEEKNFRYLIDAINIATVEALKPHLNSTNLSYVTRSSQTKIMSEGLGRTPLVPLYWLKAARNSEFISLTEQADFFGMLSAQATFVYNGIMSRTTVPAGHGLVLEMADSIEPLLQRLDGVNTPLRPLRENDEHRRLSSTLYAREARDRNIADAEQRVLRLWQDFNKSSADDLVERGGVDRLKYYQNLTNRLRSLRQS